MFGPLHYFVEKPEELLEKFLKRLKERGFT